MTNAAYETALPGRHQIGMVGAIRLERCADHAWNTRAASSESAKKAIRGSQGRCRLPVTAVVLAPLAAALPLAAPTFLEAPLAHPTAIPGELLTMCEMFMVRVWEDAGECPG